MHTAPNKKNWAGSLPPSIPQPQACSILKYAHLVDAVVWQELCSFCLLFPRWHPVVYADPSQNSVLQAYVAHRVIGQNFVGLFVYTEHHRAVEQCILLRVISLEIIQYQKSIVKLARGGQLAWFYCPWECSHLLSISTVKNKKGIFPLQTSYVHRNMLCHTEWAVGEIMIIDPLHIQPNYEHLVRK